MKRGRKPSRALNLPLAQDWSTPFHLKGVAKAEFEQTVNLLRQRGTLDRTDKTLVVRRAELCQVAHDAYKGVQGDDLVGLSDRGNAVVNPVVKVHLQASTAIHRIDAELGLTPSSARSSPIATSTSTSARWAHLLGDSEAS
jgi:P27 family predicted phage terminase small subunit